MTEPSDNSVQKLWQSQPVEVTRMSAEVLRKRARKLEHRVWWRNAREYVGTVVGVALFGNFLWKTHDILLRVAYALFMAGMIWIAIQIHRKGSARRISLGSDTSTNLLSYRAELERQRDVVQNVWPWYLLPLVPGFIVYTAAHAIAFPRVSSWAGLALLDAVIGAIFFGLWKMNQRAARCLQRMIDDLNRAQ